MKNNKCKISVGIVSYNSHADIRGCLKSLKESTDTKNINLDIFIYDNCSSDVKILKKMIKSEHPDVNLIEGKENKGFGYGHNQIISRLDSEFHLILNPDIEFSQDSINKLISYIKKDTSIGLITPEIRNQDNSIQHLPKVFPKIRFVLSSTFSILRKYRTDYTMSNPIIEKPTDIEICTGCFMLTRTKYLKKINGFDERFFLYFEDFDLSMKIREHGRIVYYPLTNVTHAWHRDTKKKIKPFLLQVISMFKFYNKWGLYGKK